MVSADAFLDSPDVPAKPPGGMSADAFLDAPDSAPKEKGWRELFAAPMEAASRGAAGLEANIIAPFLSPQSRDKLQEAGLYNQKNPVVEEIKAKGGAKTIDDYERLFASGVQQSPVGQYSTAMYGAIASPVAPVFEEAGDLARKAGVNQGTLDMAGALGSIAGVAGPTSPTAKKGVTLPAEAENTSGNILRNNQSGSIKPPPPAPYNPLETHTSISKSYGDALANANQYYDFMRQQAEGKQVPSMGIKNNLAGIISDIQNTPFHEATTELPTLKSIYDKMEDGNQVNVIDLVDLKKALNNGFNPKRFTDASDTPYIKLGDSVDNLLNTAAKNYPNFGDAKTLADKNWVNTVSLPFTKNTVLQRFWKPEDYFAQKNLENGLAESLPDQTLERANNMISKINNPDELNAITRTLSPGLSASIKQSKIQELMHGNTNRAIAAGKAVYYGTTGRLPTALRSAADVINPQLTSKQKILLNALKKESPNLPNYDKQFQELQAIAKNPWFTFREGQLGLPAPDVFATDSSGNITSGGNQIQQARLPSVPPDIIEKYVKESPSDKRTLPPPLLGLPAPSTAFVDSSGNIAARPQLPLSRRASQIIEKNPAQFGMLGDARFAYSPLERDQYPAALPRRNIPDAELMELERRNNAITEIQNSFDAIEAQQNAQRAQQINQLWQQNAAQNSIPLSNMVLESQGRLRDLADAIQEPYQETALGSSFLEALKKMRRQ